MEIYWVVWAFIVLMSFLKVNRLSKNTFQLFCVFLVFFIGFRHKVGGDWVNYVGMFEEISKLPFILGVFYTDMAYGFINWVAYDLGYQIYTVNLVCAIVFCIGFYYFSVTFKKNIWITSLVFFTYTIVAVVMGYSRQGVAIGLLCIAFATLFRRPNKMIYFLWVLFAMLFHKTSVIMLLFIPLINSKIFQKRIFFYLYILLSLLFMVFVFQSMQSDDNLYLNGEVSSKGGVQRMIVHLVPVVIYLRWHKYFKKVLGKNNRILDLFVFFILLFFLLSFSFSTIADRFGLYFIIFDAIVFIKFIDILNTKNKNVFLSILVLQYSVLFYIWTFYSEATKLRYYYYDNLLFHSF